jgi:hypothetical protein
MPPCFKNNCSYDAADAIPIRHTSTAELKHVCPTHARDVLATRYYTPIEVEQ